MGSGKVLRYMSPASKIAKVGNNTATKYVSPVEGYSRLLHILEGHLGTYLPRYSA